MPSCLNGHLRSNPDPLLDYNYQIFKFGQIRSPGEKYMLVEEADSRGYNHKWWHLAPREWGYDPVQLWSALAIWHGDSSTLGFCDGHADRHKWVDQYTLDRWDRILQQPGDLYGKDRPPAGQTTDIDYMARGWPYEDR